MSYGILYQTVLKRGYKFLLDYFPFIKGSLFDKLWIIVEEPDKVYELTNVFIIDTTDDLHEDFDFILTSVKIPTDLISFQFNSFFDVYVALHKYTDSFDNGVLACNFFVSVRDKISKKINVESFWFRNPYYSKTLIMSDDAIIEKFNSKTLLNK